MKLILTVFFVAFTAIGWAQDFFEIPEGGLCASVPVERGDQFCVGSFRRVPVVS